MIYRLAKPGDEKALTELIRKFRSEIARMRGRPGSYTSEEARRELTEDLSQERFIIYVAEEETLSGYCVFKDEERTVWMEQLFVDPACRRKGIVRQFVTIGEALAESRGQETLFFWVHPDNRVMLSFLKSTGYDVLNLIEIRRRRNGETCPDRVEMFGHTLYYGKGPGNEGG